MKIGGGDEGGRRQEKEMNDSVCVTASYPGKARDVMRVRVLRGQGLNLIGSKGSHAATQTRCIFLLLGGGSTVASLPILILLREVV